MSKNIKRTLLAIVILVFALTVPSFAATLNRIEIESNKIDVSLTCDMGNVRGIDATFQIEGEVELATFAWSGTIDKNAFKEYRYDKVKNTMNVYVVAPTGGNLVDTEGKLIIGAVTIKAKGSDTDKSYNIKLQDLTLVDSTYNANIPSDKKENTDTGFTYVKAANPSNPGGEDPSNPGGNNNNTTGNTTNPGGNTLDPSDNNTGTSGGVGDNQTGNDGKEQEDDKKSVMDHIADKILPKTGTNKTVYIIILLAGVAVISAIITVMIKKENEKGK